MIVLITCIFVILILSTICGYAGIGSFSADLVSHTAESPTVWDVVSFTGSGFWDLLTFSIDGLPAIFSVIFYFILLVILACIVYLIRGTN